MTLRVFSMGGGVQSTAVMVLAAQGRVQYDHFLFANVGEDSENPDTLEYLNRYAFPFAQENGIDLVEIKRHWRRGPRKGERVTLYEELVRDEKRSIEIPAHMKSGAPGNRNCTKEFKVLPISRWLKQRGATKRQPAVVGLGISIDEIHRARTNSGVANEILEYPLIDLNLSRQDCRNIIRQAGLPVPPKSSCYFCPFKSPNEWQRLKSDKPELFEKAVYIEEKINETRQRLGRDPVFLHNHARPLRDAVSDQGMLFTEQELDMCESGFCMT